jgi:hypothetical protein
MAGGLPAGNEHSRQERRKSERQRSSTADRDFVVCRDSRDKYIEAKSVKQFKRL